MNRSTRWRSGLVAAAIASVFAVRVAVTATSTSATFDEPEYITAGYSYVVTHELRLDLWHPPLAFWLSGLAVRARFDLPFAPDPLTWSRGQSRRVAREFLYADGRDADAILRIARLPSLLLGIFTILAIGAWAARLWGARAGWFALVLAASDPNLIAQAAVATPDIAVTCFVVLALFGAWSFTRTPTVTRWLATCAAVALAVASKHIGLLLVPLIAVVLAISALQREGDAVKRRRAYLRAVAATVAIALAGVGLAIALGVPVGDTFAELAQGVRGQLWHLNNLPLAYLHGAIRRGGWWDYYVVVLALKLPLALIALIAVAAALPRAGARLGMTAIAAVVVPAAAFVAFVTWTQIDIGLRLILPAVPFLIVLAARAASLPGKPARWLTSVALVATVASSTLCATRELGYFNAIAQATGGGEAWLTDSNLDWGQDFGRLVTYVRDHGSPPVYLAYYGGASPTHAGLRHGTLPTAQSFPPNADLIDDVSDPLAVCRAPHQLVAISEFRQLGIIEHNRFDYDWLARLTPIAELGVSIRVYDVTDSAEAHVRLAGILGVASPAGACEKAHAIALDPNTAARFSTTR